MEAPGELTPGFGPGHMKILVIIPAYNEADSLPAVIREVRNRLTRADILVIDDGSTDATGAIAREEKVLLLEHPYNMGIGATMQTGFLYALRNGYDLAVQVDGDGQHDPQYIPDLIAPILKGEADVMIGSRYLENRGFQSSILRRAGIRFFSILNSALTGKKATDPTSGFRAFNRKAITFLAEDYPSDYPEAESLVLFHNHQVLFKEISVTMKERQGGASSINSLRSVYYMLKVTLSMTIGMLKRR